MLHLNMMMAFAIIIQDKPKDNGLWFIQGRIDFQIKMNGYRMELEEIEAQLRQSDRVREAVVVPVYRNDKVVHLMVLLFQRNTLKMIWL